MFSAPVKAETTPAKVDHITQNEIQSTFPWIEGGVVSTMVLLVSMIWWVSRLKFTVEETQKRQDNFEKQMLTGQQQEHSQRIELRDGLRADLKRDIAESASGIMGELKLFAVEIRQTINNLSEKLEMRDVTVNRLRDKADRLTSEMTDLTRQLQNQNIQVHSRRFNNGPPSNPHNYDDD